MSILEPVTDTLDWNYVLLHTPGWECLQTAGRHQPVWLVQVLSVMDHELPQIWGLSYLNRNILKVSWDQTKNNYVHDRDLCTDPKLFTVTTEYFSFEHCPDQVSCQTWWIWYMYIVISTLFAALKHIWNTSCKDQYLHQKCLLSEPSNKADNI